MTLQYTTTTRVGAIEQIVTYRVHDTDDATDIPAPTMTVAQAIDRLKGLSPDLKVTSLVVSVL